MLTVPVFVYGTLRVGDSRNGALRGSECVTTGATLRGFTLRNLGAYPAIETATGEGAESATVTGEVYRVNRRTLRTLDAIEGFRRNVKGARNLYRCERVNVRLPNGSTVRALCYVWDGAPLTDCPTLPGGDWIAYRFNLDGAEPEPECAPGECAEGCGCDVCPECDGCGCDGAECYCDG